MSYLTLHSSAQTRKGQAKRANDDAVLQDARAGVFAVADGSTWAGAGTPPARILLNTVIDRADELGNALDSSMGPRTEDRTPIRDAFSRAFEDASTRVRTEHRVPDDQIGPTTTGTILVVREDFAAIGHVGNTRAYLLRADRAFRITKEHTIAQRMADAGHIEPAAVPHHPERKTLYQAVGQPVPLEVEVTCIELLAKDRVVLLSDGVYDMVRGKELHRMHCKARSTESLVRSVVELSLERKALDDLACVVVAIDEAAPEAEPETIPPHQLILRPPPPSNNISTDSMDELEPAPMLPERDKRTLSEPQIRVDRLIGEVQHFRNIEMFEGMTEPQILHVIGLMRPTTLQPGDYLLREGDPSDTMYIITLGKVEIIRSGQIIARIGHGDVVGEMSLLDGQSRSAGVRAREITRVLGMRQQDVGDLVRADPMFAVRLYHNLARTLARRLRLMNP